MPAHLPPAAAGHAATFPLAEDLRTWLSIAAREGRLPWGPQARRDLVDGWAIGARVVGQPRDVRSLNWAAPAELATGGRYAVLLLSDALAAFIGAHQPVRAYFTGCRTELDGALAPLAHAGIVCPAMGTLANGLLGDVTLPGLGRQCVAVVSGAFLGQAVVPEPPDNDD